MAESRRAFSNWVRPIVVGIAAFLASVVVSNFILPGNLVGRRGEFGSVKTNSGYKITCHFQIKNKGYLKVRGGKIQLNIPKGTKIEEIDIPMEYNYLHEIISGGKGHSFAVLLIEGLKGRHSLEGSVSFSQYSKWEKNHINPLSFSE